MPARTSSLLSRVFGLWPDGSHGSIIVRSVVASVVGLSILSTPTSSPGAEPAPSNVENRTAAPSAQSAVGPGDTLEIRVYGDETASMFSGRFQVGQDGTVNYPLIGLIRADGKTVAELGSQISQGLEKGMSVVTVVTVTIASYAPVFLIGDISRPGPTAFRPGMDVIELVLLSGGVATPGRVDVETAVREIADLEILTRSSEAERARIWAEITNTEFDPGKMPDGPKLDDSFAAVQRRIFEARKRANQAQLQAYEAQRERASQEIASLRQSIEIQDREIEEMERELATQTKLGQRGLLLQSKITDLRQEHARARLQALQFRTEVFRAEQTLLLTEQNINDLDIKTDAQDLSDLAELDLTIRRNHAKVELSKQQLIAEGSRSPVSTEKPFTPQVKFTLFRVADGQYHQGTVVIDSATLARGDIVRVDVVETEDIGDARRMDAVAPTSVTLGNNQEASPPRETSRTGD